MDNHPTASHLPQDLAGEASSAPASAEYGPKLGFWQHLAISVFWFAINLHWGAYLVLIIPSQATRLAPSVGMDKAEISGWTIGLGAIVGALVPPLIGAWSDRCTARLGRRRPFVIAGTVINLVALGLFYLAFVQKSFAGYLLAYTLVNFGNNVATAAFSGIIPDMVPKAERGYASGMMAVMQQVGTIGGLGIGAVLIPRHDGLATLIIALTLAVISGLTVAFTRERPIREAEPFQLSELKDCFWVSPRQYPDFAWVWVQRALFTLGWNMIQTTLLFFIADVVGARPAEASFGILGMIVLVGAIPTGIFGGALSDRIGRKPIIFTAGMAMAVTGIAFASLAAAPPGTRLPLLYALGIIWGFGYGAYISVDWALGTDVLPNPDAHGKDMGVWHLSMTLPMSFAAPLAALILKPFATATESYRPGGYTLLYLIASGLLALCAILIFRVRKAR